MGQVFNLRTDFPIGRGERSSPLWLRNRPKPPVSNKSMIKRSAVAELIALALAARAFCQNPDLPDPHQCERVAERLSAASDREKAWGAHAAAACRTPNLATEIAAQLDRMHSDLNADASNGWRNWINVSATIELKPPPKRNGPLSRSPVRAGLPFTVTSSRRSEKVYRPSLCCTPTNFEWTVLCCVVFPKTNSLETIVSSH